VSVRLVYSRVAALSLGDDFVKLGGNLINRQEAVAPAFRLGCLERRDKGITL
jgi:hypothetical protein